VLFDERRIEEFEELGLGELRWSEKSKFSIVLMTGK